MVVLGVIVFAVLAAVAIWTLISPRSVYWVLHAWAHRDPEANEPSDLAYGLWRVGSFIALVIFVVVGWMLVSSSLDQQREQAQAADCEEVLLPALEEAWSGPATSESDMEAFAQEHGLEMESDVSEAPSWAEDEPATTSYTFLRDGEEVLYASTSEYAFGDNPSCVD